MEWLFSSYHKSLQTILIIARKRSDHALWREIRIKPRVLPFCRPDGVQVHNLPA